MMLSKNKMRRWCVSKFLVMPALALSLVLFFSATAFAEELWTQNGPVNSNVNAVPLSPHFDNDSTIFAGTPFGVYRSVNKGKDWTLINNGLTSTNVRSITMSTGFQTDKTVFAGTNGGVFKSTNSGDLWAPVNTGLSNTDVRSLAISKDFVNDRTLFAGTAGGVFRTTDAGATWAPVNSNLTNTDVRALAISPNFANDNTLFAGTNAGGVFKSIDRGSTWSQINTGIDNFFITDIAISPEFSVNAMIFVSTNGGGVYKSINAGGSWSQANNGLTSTKILAITLTTNFPNKGFTVVAGTDGDGVFKSSDDGASWKKINKGLMHLLVLSLENLPCYCLDRTLFAGTEGGGVYNCVVADEIAPTTTLGTNPVSADGENGWFKTAPSITLTADEPGTTYYSWNSATGPWTTYSGSFTAIEGENTLYYYSVDTSGNVESVKSQAFKVDSGLPTNPSLSSPSHTVSAISTDTTVDIAISGAADAVSGLAGFSVEWSKSSTTVPDQTVDLLGTTTSTTSLALSDGSWYFHLRTKDMAGHWTSTVTIGPFIIDTKPPTTTISSNPASPDGANGWFKTVPSITLTRNEAGTTYYQWGSTTGSWTTYSGSFTAPEGQHTLYYYSVDSVGNTEAVKSQLFKVDTVAPAAFNLVSPANGATVNNDKGQTFEWTASSDADSGLSKYQLYVDGSLNRDNISASATSYTLSTSLSVGSHTWYVRAVDAAGNTRDSSATFTLTVNDVVPPTTTISPTSTSWYKTSPSISLTRNEAGTSYYSWNSSTGPWTTYSGAFTAPAGENTVHYYSVDSAGNTESVKNQLYKIDVNAPAAFNLVSPANGATVNNDKGQTFEWTASSDSESGLASYQLYVDGSLNKSGISASSTSVTLSSSLTPGSHTWYIKALDAVGNATDSSSTFTLTVNDVVPPTTSISPSSTTSWYKTPPSITLTRNEAGTTYYQWDSTTGSWTTYTTSFTAPEGQHTLYFYSVDTAGNTEVVKSQLFKVDTVAPTAFNLVSPADGATVNNDKGQTFEWTASSDADSGLSKYQLYVDGSLNRDNISASATSYTLSTSLSVGSHTWYVRAVDAAGNTRDSSATFTLTVNDVVPPTTSLTTNPASPDGANGWFKTVPSITLTRNEAGTTYYQWGSTTGSWTTYSGSFTAPEGQHTLYYYSVDTAGNIETTKSKAFKVDTILPTAFNLVSPADGATVNNDKGQTFEWTASSDTNLASYQLYINNSLNRTVSATSTKVTLSSSLAPGSYTWYVRAVDVAGNTTNSSATHTLTVVDVVPPTTSLTTNPSSPDGANGWFKTTPSITLTRNEAGTTYYQWDTTGGLWNEYTGAFTAPEGQHVLYYYSIDTAGNIESTKNKTFKVDTVAPTSFDLVSPANGATVNNDKGQTFEWTASSDTNLSKYDLYIDGSLNRTVSAPSTSVTLSSSLTPGSHTWHVKAVDSAGHTVASSSTYSLTVNDVVAPTTSISSNPASPDGDNGWYKTVPSITLTRNEPGTTYYQWNSTTGTWTTYSGAFLAPEGNNTLYYYSVDSNGNTESIRNRAYKVDTIAPSSFTLSSPANGATVDNDKGQTFSWNASSDANLAKYQLYVDGNLNRDSLSASATSVTLSSSLLPGTHTWFIRAVDVAGNTRDSADTWSLTVNDVMPPTTTLSTNPTSANGTNGWFKGTAPSVTLTRSEAGVTYYQWNSTTGAWTSYTATTGGLTAPEGINTLYYYSVDTKGNTESVKSKEFKVDTSIPSVSISQPADGAILSGTSYAIAGSASDSASSGVSKVEVSIDGAWKTATGTSGWTYNWSLPADGTYTISARAVDVAGNVGNPASSISVKVDNSSPSVTSVSPAEGATGVSTSAGVTALFSEPMDPSTINSSTVTLMDSANNPVAGTVTYDAGTRTATLKPTNNLISSMTYTATITTGVRDLAGTAMATAKVWSFTTAAFVDAPATSITLSPTTPDGSNGWYKTIPTITLTSDRPGIIYYQWDSTTGPWMTAGGGFAALEGQHTLYFYSMDTSNNTEVVKSVVLKVDAQAPSKPANVKATALCESKILIEWEASTDNIAVAGYNVYNADTGQKIAGTTTTSFTHTGLASNTAYRYYVAAFDAAGNQSPVSNTVEATTFQGSKSTAPGTSVNVELGNGVKVSFSNVVVSGTTSATVITDPPYGTPTPTFRFRGYHIDISTTAGYAGAIMVTVSYDESLIKGNEKNLKFMHWNGQKWEDITVEVDTVNNTITGMTTSLSPFGVGEEEGTTAATSIAFGHNTNLLAALAVAMMLLGTALVLRRSTV